MCGTIDYLPHKLTDTMKLIVVFLALTNVCLGDVSHILQDPSKHYNFEYKTGRFPGHVDRVQSETGDGSGRAQGSYSFIDPNSKVRTVQYTVDGNGYHPSLRNYNDNQNYNANINYNNNAAVARETENQRRLYQQTPQATQDTPAVAHAKNMHHYLWNKIADEHARIHAAASYPHYNQYPSYNQYHNYNRNI